MIGKNLDLDASEKLGYNNINSCDINIRQYIWGREGVEMGQAKRVKAYLYLCDVKETASVYLY